MKKLLLLLVFLPSLVCAQGIPPTLNTWYSIPNTTLHTYCKSPEGTGGCNASNNNCNGNNLLDCFFITPAWSSGAFDATNDFMYITGGGHNDYYGNDYFRINLNTLAADRVQGPTLPPAAQSTNPDCIPDSNYGGQCFSNAKHTYDGLIWAEWLHKMVQIGGVPSPGGGFVRSIWLIDPVNHVETRLTDNYSISGTGGTGKTRIIGTPSNVSDATVCTAADEANKVIYWVDQLDLFALDPVANTSRRLTNRSTGFSQYFTCEYDPENKRVMLIGNGQFGTFDVSGGPTVTVPGSGDASFVSRTQTGCGTCGASAPGIVYDPNLHKIVTWGSTTNINTIYISDPASSYAWTNTVTTGAQSPLITSANQGVFKRFRRSVKKGVYVYYGDMTKNALALRLYAPDNSIVIKDTSGSTQTNRVIPGIGRPFRAGDIPLCPEAWANGAAITTQTDVKTRWPDGSLRFGLVSFVLPTLSANASQTVYFVNGSSCHNTGGLTPAQALASGYNFDVTMTLVGGQTKKASARAMLAATSAASGGVDPSAIAGIPANIVTGLQTYALTDITGQTRPQNGSYDLGAYTYAPLTPAASGLAGDCTLYASPSGVDTNNGTTPTTPKTLRGASTATVPGSVVCLKGGTYGLSATFYPAHNGTSGAYITYKAYGDSEPILNWTAGASAPDLNMIHFFSSTLFSNTQYLAVEGLTLDGANAATVGLKCQNSHHLRFTRNTLRNMGASGIATVRCDYVVSDANKITHTGYVQGGSSALSYNSHQFFDSFTGFHSLAINNIISGGYDATAHQDGNGIILDLTNGTFDPASANTPPVLVANNVIYNNGSRCIELYVVNRAWVVNNTCYKNTLDTVQVGIGEIVVHDAKDSFIVNNLAYAWNNHNTYQQIGTVSGMTYRTNLSFAGALNFTPSDPTQFCTADPGFVNAPVVNPTTGGQYATALPPSQLGTGLSIAAGWRLWGSGSVMTDFIIEDRSAARAYDMDPNSSGNRPFHPIFECRFFPSNTSVDCSAILETAWVSNTAANSTSPQVVSAYSLTAGNTSPAARAVNWAGNNSEDFTTHKFTNNSRAHKEFWVGTAPGTILIDHNLAYLASTGLIGNFDPSFSLNATYVTNIVSQWTNANKTIQGSFAGNQFIGNWQRQGADSGGSHPWIGLYPTWDIQYLYNPLNQNLYDKMIGNADLHGRLQTHMRELDSPAGRGLYYDAAYSTAHTATLGRPVSIAARRGMSSQDFSETCSGAIGADKINFPATPVLEWSTYSVGYPPHHAPSVGYIAYLLTGRYFYLEELQMEAAYFLAWSLGCDTSYRHADQGYINPSAAEIRGIAWALRSIAHAYSVSPDGTPEQAYFKWYFLQNTALLEGQTDTTITDTTHQNAWNFGHTVTRFPDAGAYSGVSPLGQFYRAIPDDAPPSNILRWDGTPPRNVEGCTTANVVDCGNNPWMEGFITAALGEANDIGLNTANLLRFRSKYYLCLTTSGVSNAHLDQYLMPGKVEEQYAGLAAGQGWFPNWQSIGQYLQSVRTVFNQGGGSDQQYEYIALGAMGSFGGVAGVCSTDGVTAYTTVRGQMQTQLGLINRFNGTTNPGDPDFDSPKWAMLPRSSLSTVPTMQPPPIPVPVVPGAPAVQILP